MIQVRYATDADLGLLSEIGRQTFSDSFGQDNTPANMQAYLEEAFHADQIRKELLEKETHFFLAFDGITPAGYAKVRRNNEVDETLGENSIELQRIYVVKNYQGKKVGALLIQSCIDHAKENGFEWIWLGVWEHNRNAKSFYQKWGFEKFDEHIFQMGDDPQTDWLMRKKITS